MDEQRLKAIEDRVAPGRIPQVDSGALGQVAQEIRERIAEMRRLQELTGRHDRAAMKER